MPRSIWSYINQPYRTIALLRPVLKQRLITHSIFAQLRRKITPIPTPNKWVFIIGCYNSGTTVLLNMLSQHPDVSALDEGVFRTNELVTPEELGWTRMWYKVQEEVRLKATDTYIDAAAVQKDWSFFLDTKRSVLIEKSIVNSARIPWLQANFPNAYFIFIVRNGYAVAEGIQRKVIHRRYPIPAEFGKTYPIGMCAEQWVQSNRIVEQDLLLVNRVHRLTYEDLCMTPINTLRALWEFLELDTMNTGFSAEQEWKIHGKQNTLQNMNQRSVERLSAADRLAIESVAGEMLQHYGYPLLDC